MDPASQLRPLRTVGRCELFGEIGSGGMATVHLGRLLAAGGFSRIVAIKRMHEQLAKDPEFVSMFLDEARLVSRIQHPNVRATLDLIEEDGALFIVMEYVAGVTLRRLFYNAAEQRERIPIAIALHIMCGVLHGLQAAHDATSPEGTPLMLVHRDVSPENILVGSDGLTRLLDFGLAKALGRSHLTQPGNVKGKLTVMAPEQVQGGEVTRRTDVFASGVVLWQALTSRRLIKGEHLAEVAHNVLHQELVPPSALAEVPKEVDDVVMRALERDPEARWPDAESMALALEGAVEPVPQSRVATWIEAVAAKPLAERAAMVAAIERTPVGLAPKQPGMPEKSDPRYVWVPGPWRAAVRGIPDAFRDAIARDDQGRVDLRVSLRNLIERRPRATIAASLSIVALTVLVVVLSSGEREAATRARTGLPGIASAEAMARHAAADRIDVPAGSFLFGCNSWADRRCAPDEMPAHRVHVDAFQIDRHEVTVKQYTECVAAGACNADGLDQHGIDGTGLETSDKCNYDKAGRHDHPINCVSHAQAEAYCRWTGGRLPTEAEWEKAAAGSDSWPFPTGEASIDCRKAIMSHEGDGCGRGTTWPVGSRPEGASPHGALDMAGNVAEWVADHYAPRYAPEPEDNPRGPSDGNLWSVRGGGWRDGQDAKLRTSARGKRAEKERSIDVGFRCAR